MNQHLHLITLGVRDLEASRKFYLEILGWKPSTASSDDVTFIQAGGAVLALYPREKLAEDAVVSPEGSGFSGIVKEPQKVFWGGYSSYFADPDGYLWEVAYNPFFPFDESGNLKLE